MGFTDLIGSFANPFGAPSQGEWNLSRGVYTQKNGAGSKSIIFFYETPKGEDPSQKTAVDTITDSGGRRLAVYEYAYRDGQALADLGRKGETFTFNIKFHGPNYQTKFQEFLNVVVNSNQQGTLLHPVRGSLTVRFRDWEYNHRYDEWSTVNIKAVFVEDSTDLLSATNLPAASQDSALRSALQLLTNLQAAIQQSIFNAGALALLPNAIITAMQNRLTSITGQFSALLGTLAATYSTDAQLQSLAAQAATLTGGVTALTSGSTQAASLPPVFQVGFDPTTQSAINSQIQAFISANQITPQQAVFSANQVRAAITVAINEARTNLGNNAYDTEVQYRGMAVAVQTVTEAAISTAQSLITLYTVPYDMSLRKVAFLNGLTPDDGNTIEALNPYLASVNYVSQGTQLVVPA